MEQNDSKYLPELMAEKDSIDPSFEHAVRLISQEIDNIKNPKKETSKSDSKKNILDVSGKPQKVECDILVPAERFPSVNFVGRLIGPGGATMKGLQELTNTKMAVLGKGSVRESERKKAEELKDFDEKYFHLNYPLHVHISAVGPVPQAFVNVGRAVAEVQKLLVVDDATEAQYGVQAALAHQAMRGRGRGARGGGRGAQNQRGGFQRGGRGGGGGRGMAGARGQGRGGGRGRGRGQTQQFSQMQQAAGGDNYADDYSFDSYGMSGGTSFDQSYEGYGDNYGASYDSSSFGDEYGDGSYNEDFSYGQDVYDSYGNGAGTQNATNFGAQQFRGKMRGGAGSRGRQKPY